MNSQYFYVKSLLLLIHVSILFHVGESELRILTIFIKCPHNKIMLK